MTPTRHVVRQASYADAAAITRILAAGFYDDPPLKWIMPNNAERSRLSPAFFQPFVDLALTDGKVFVTDDVTGTALWLHVDVTAAAEDDPTALRDRVVAGIGTENAKRFFVLDELFTTHHPGHESHEYLMFVGTVPEHQNRGVGTTLLRHRLAELDLATSPAYLEASSGRSAALYARLGFAPIGETVTLPDGPPVYPMWRGPVQPPPTWPPSATLASAIKPADHLPGDPA